MAFNNDYGQSPRNYFVNTLIQITRDIYYMIFVKRVSIIEIYPALKGVIGSLNEESQKDLAPLYKKIEQFENRQVRVTRHDIEKTYNELMQYLHTGYLKEVNWIKPRFAAEKLEFTREEQK